MARRKHTTAVRRDTGLEPASSASPTRPPRYNIKCTRPNGRLCLINYYGTYAAKSFVETLESYAGQLVWIDHTTAKCGDVTIKCAELEAIVEHEYTEAETHWSVEHNDPQALAGLKGLLSSNEPIQVGTHPGSSRSASASSVRAPRTGLIDMNTICAELGIDPRKARSILRSKKVAKPAAGWAFPADQVDTIKAMLRA